MVLACLVASPVAYSASIDAGRALYTENCLGCHGSPPNAMKINNLVAANRPELIRSQIQTNSAMRILAALTDEDLANVATYLANPIYTDADCVFGWGEETLPQLLTPRTQTDKGGGFDFRFYRPANVYVGVSISSLDQHRHLYFLDAKTTNGLVDLGEITNYLGSALAAGCP